MKRGGFKISEELFKKKLQVLKEFKITGIDWNPNTCELSVYLYAGEELPVGLPETLEGGYTVLRQIHD